MFTAQGSNETDYLGKRRYNEILPTRIPDGSNNSK